eukprot:CAMPEP_0202965416 /NCGR_PEP_ID=MMETSP1396-20130829/9398_1 /ASSEMBLY_ACC=CAM_ASM_000872 /TAXON_ID= /ORGANISM="Pseudokeronopsis sp., Strain Brazil" /LENGTH=117 /DNA_ID=CAMNT_0049688123 /DNA_START=126 /DNA_END=480 /DNA_ORIENTATION=-
MAIYGSDYCCGTGSNCVVNTPEISDYYLQYSVQICFLSLYDGQSNTANGITCDLSCKSDFIFSALQSALTSSEVIHVVQLSWEMMDRKLLNASLPNRITLTCGLELSMGMRSARKLK